MNGLTDGEINRLATLLRDAARAKQRRAREVHPNDRADLEESALRDFDLRNKLIGLKAVNRDGEQV